MTNELNFLERLEKDSSKNINELYNEIFRITWNIADRKTPKKKNFLCCGLRHYPNLRNFFLIF